MLEMTTATAANYLVETGRVPRGVPVAVRELGGGVSNAVLRVDIPGRPPFVLKQSRERLRVALEWYSPLERIWTERAALELLAELLPAGMVPRVLFDDRAEFLFAMQCAPDAAVTWKSRLMAGETQCAGIARKIGAALGAIHADAAEHPELSGSFADTSLFDSLRIDPYYRTVARVHPDLDAPIADLITTMAAVPDPTLVLGDFSPKNILVHDESIILIDFECAHRGDPAFDLGFFFSHLFLKARRPNNGTPDPSLLADSWSAYTERAGVDPTGDRARRAVRHAAACLLARLDGKSPVEYRHELDQDAIRRFARELLLTPIITETNDPIRLLLELRY